MGFWRRLLKWLAVICLATGLVIAGTLVGWRISGETTGLTAIGKVTVEAQSSLTGEVEAFIPVAGWGNSG